MSQVYEIDAKRGPPTGCLIFLHGSGDTGPGMAETVKLLLDAEAQFPHIKILFPTAPMLPFSAYGGMNVNTWYDISSFTDDGIENTKHIEQSAKLVNTLIQCEIAEGIPVNRIAVAGFSRGGAMSYYIGYYFMKDLAGVGVLSSWLPKSSILREHLKEKNNSYEVPPLFQSHGSSDFVISRSLGENTVNFLNSVGIKTHLKIYPGVGHEVRPQILKDLYSFVQSVIPDI